MGLPATGKPITITGINIYRVANGKIVDYWHHEDMLGVMQQLGMVPASGQGGG
jgi:predicted ester cyclase